MHIYVSYHILAHISVRGGLIEMMSILRHDVDCWSKGVCFGVCSDLGLS